jgi:glutamate decarboxylase
MPRVAHISPSIAPAYTGRLACSPIPSLHLPDDAMEPDATYQFIHDELMLDGSSRLNLVTFVTTWMDSQAEKLMAETFDKNMIDRPPRRSSSAACMVADLFHAENLRGDDSDSAIGVSTTKSSEAVSSAGWRSPHNHQPISTARWPCNVRLEFGCNDRFSTRGG